MKDTDSLADSYRESFGDSSWELDALDPRMIADLIREAILGIRDDDAWEKS